MWDTVPAMYDKKKNKYGREHPFQQSEKQKLI